MKVLKAGIVPPNVKNITCPKCKSKLEYAPKDVKNCTDGRDNWTDYWIDCPLCKEQIDLKPGQRFN